MNKKSYKYILMPFAYKTPSLYSIHSVYLSTSVYSKIKSFIQNKIKNMLFSDTIKKHDILNYIRSTTNGSSFYFQALATKRNMIERAKKLLKEHNIDIYRYDDPFIGISTGIEENKSTWLAIDANTWVGETNEQVDIHKVMSIALLQTYPLVLKYVILPDQVLYLAYGHDFPQVSPDVLTKELLEGPLCSDGHNVIHFSLNPLIIIYTKDVDIENK